MDLMKTVNNAAARLKEDAAGGAVGAGGVAAAATPLFASMVKRSVPETKQPGDTKKSKKKKGLGLQEAFDDIGMQGQTDPAAGSPRTASDPSFDASGIVSKLKGLENKEKQDYRDTVSFGLEDDNGGLVRVSVRTEQAQDFEKALQSYMADEDEDLEIAEILFKLRDQFDIVDVQWPEVEEDEEEDMSLAQTGDASGMPPDGELPPGDEDMLGADAGMPPGGDDQATSVLTQVIDMMKADAEARKAEARAREAEAKAKEAESVVNQAMAKVKQEEQFLDMDTYNKAKKDEEREAKRLAQLAKWKHDMSKEQGVSDDDFGGDDQGGMPPQGGMPAPRAPEEEEYTMRRPAPVAKQQPRKAVAATRVRPQEVADFILSRVKK